MARSRCRIEKGRRRICPRGVERIRASFDDAKPNFQKDTGAQTTGSQRKKRITATVAATTTMAPTMYLFAASHDCEGVSPALNTKSGD